MPPGQGGGFGDVNQVPRPLGADAAHKSNRRRSALGAVRAAARSRM
jgi:hypothetical protein